MARPLKITKYDDPAVLNRWAEEIQQDIQNLKVGATKVVAISTVAPGQAGGSTTTIINQATALTVVNTSTNLSAATNTIIRANSSGGAITITVPPATALNQGQTIDVIKVSSDTNAVNVTSISLIDGQSTQTITAQYVSLLIYSTGATWEII